MERAPMAHEAAAASIVAVAEAAEAASAMSSSVGASVQPPPPPPLGYYGARDRLMASSAASLQQQQQQMQQMHHLQGLHHHHHHQPQPQHLHHPLQHHHHQHHPPALPMGALAAVEDEDDEDDDDGEDLDDMDHKHPDMHDAKRRRLSTRRFKDPSRPKKPVTPYLYFMKDVRERVSAKNPHLPFGDIGRAVGRLWRDELPPEVKQLYIDRSNIDKERHRTEMQIYERPRDGARLQRRKKDPSAPKKARSSYAFFMTSIRPLIVQAHPSAAFGEVGRLVGQRWNEMSPEERRPFEELAEADKARHALEMDSFLKARQDGDMQLSEEAFTAATTATLESVRAAAQNAAAATARALDTIKIPLLDVPPAHAPDDAASAEHSSGGGGGGSGSAAGL